MKILSFLRNHLSFIITFIGVTFFLLVAIVMIASPFLRELVVVNVPYLASITLLSLVPVAMIRKLEWYPEAAPLYSWVLLLLISGYYYFIFHEPNLIGFIFDVVTRKINPVTLFSMIFGSFTFSGIFYLFYSLMSFISGRKDGAFSLKVDAKSFAIWSLTYLFYLNAMTSLINPVFRRPV